MSPSRDFWKPFVYVGKILVDCLQAASSSTALSFIRENTIAGIRNFEKLRRVISDTYAGKPTHRAFEIYPSLPRRQLLYCLVRPISDWAFSQMIEELDRQGTDAAYSLYRSWEGTRAGASLAGRLFENRVHNFFQPPIQVTVVEPLM